jgi:hypothetical protein
MLFKTSNDDDISRLDTSKSPSILQKLNHLSTPVFLSGSQYFGNTNEDSDWDFYCGNDVNIGIFTTLGFEEEDIPTEALFGGIQKVLKYQDKDIEVHILFVGDLEKRHSVQELIANYFPNGYSCKKDNAKGIWDLATLCVDNMRSK